MFSYFCGIIMNSNCMLGECNGKSFRFVCITLLPFFFNIFYILYFSFGKFKKWLKKKKVASDLVFDAVI